MLKNRKSTILIIDSDPDTADSLSAPLKSCGFNVLSASRIDMAYKLFLSKKPDIILMDLHTESDKGYDLFSMIKPKALKNIPVIIISSEADIGTEAISEANDYIAKPLNYAEVLARINTQLKLVNMQNELEKKNRELLERNSVLQQMAITDALTGLYNRGYILNKLIPDIAHSIRYKEPVSFILADIDHFKRINDKYGHHGGDLVLKEAAAVIKSSVREVDHVIRYGGEEFLIICPNTDKPGAMHIAERIRERISNQSFMFTDKKISITVSLGIKSTIFDTHMNTEEAVHKLIEDADKAMYKAKASGRNKVVVFEDSSGTGALKKNRHSPHLGTMEQSSQPDDKFLN